MPQSKRTSMTRTWSAVTLFALLTAAPPAALANGDPVPTAAPPAPTHYERFVRSACAPCVQESYPVKTMVVAPVRLPRAPLGMPQGAEVPPRQGQMVLEVLRA